MEKTKRTQRQPKRFCESRCSSHLSSTRHPLPRVADARLLSPPLTRSNLLISEKGRGALLAACHHDGPRRPCPLPAREAHQLEMRTSLEDSQMNFEDMYGEVAQLADHSVSTDSVACHHDLSGATDLVNLVSGPGENLT